MQNQDSLVLQQYLTKAGNILLAVVCDGIGGLTEGENASGYVAEKLVEWLHHEYIILAQHKASKARIKRSVYRQFYRMNEELKQYQIRRGIKLGSTATMLLIQENQYIVAHSGDSRLYSIRNNKSKQLTKDHNQDSVLVRCVGAGEHCKPDIRFGKVKKEEGYLLCTDGFRHFLRKEELAKIFYSTDIVREEQITKRLNEIGDRAIRKGERDNLSAIYILFK